MAADVPVAPPADPPGAYAVARHARQELLERRLQPAALGGAQRGERLREDLLAGGEDRGDGPASRRRQLQSRLAGVALPAPPRQEAARGEPVDGPRGAR